IAHLGTADCCIHPPGRNETIAITPPIISSKEVAQKQATPFPRQDLLTARNRFRPNLRGWRLDEFSMFARPPPQGGSLTPGREASGCRAGPLNVPRPGRTTYLARPRRRRLRCRRPRKGGRHAVGARVYVKLRRRLAHAHAARQGRPDTLSQLVLHAWPAVGPRGRGLAPFSATEIKQPIMPAADAVRRRLCRSSI